MAKKYILTYDVETVSEGYIARCTSNAMATAFGKTEEEAGDRLAEAVSGYIEMYPEKTAKLLTVSTREVQIAD